ncbi:outer membrane beta-barrel protein [Calothrix sp. UHCC 0171]|uniref:outer membrane beta-barrel protein n=1 Tax=Calothrix sp. UHCC 0171 TaxID=3110245 RepID=UPI002B21FF37|nr:outer membrane beta-barrel protein [Calothrix sp. UHCC 0171]MEA5572632.1 outer membrane beta-barrel protein [Calothrix sp. UHCC 0171]
MRVYSITFYSLMTLLLWDMHYVAAAEVETTTTSPNIVESDVANAIANVTEPVAPPERILDEMGTRTEVGGFTLPANFDGGGKIGSDYLTQALPNLGEPNNPAIFPDAEPLSEKEVEEELGEIRYIKPRPVKQPPQPRQPNVQLLLRSSTFSSSNITAVDFLKRSDTVFVNSATLLATPKLGEDTRLVASATGGLTRFATKDDFNYNFLSFNAGVQQRLAPGMYAQLGWVQDRLYNQDRGDRILLDDSVRFTIGRQDQLSQRLRLDSFYDLRASFSEPKAQSRVANSLGARLRYDLTPKLQGALDYRLTLKDYTNQDRFDTQHQVGVDLIYNVNQDLFVGSYASYLFGSSSASSIDFNNFSVGVNVGLNISLF